MFDSELRSLDHYKRRVGLYDWANRAAALLRGTSGRRERLKAIARLRLHPGDRVLEICSGTGTNLLLIRPLLAPDALLVGLDISRPMLERSREKLRRHGADVPLVEADAAHLPFRDGAFDAVFHHGGFAEFGDKPAAAAEMLRVARYGARIVLCDVGVPADRNVGLVNRLLLKTQPEYNQPPPVNLFPSGLRDFHLGWIGGGAWYLIDFVNARD